MYNLSKFFKKVLSRIFKKASINLWWFSPPYEYVQSINEYNIHSYLGVSKEDIKSWCIVGGYLGNEVETILSNYPNVNITIFECSKRYLPRLRRKFANESRVEIVEKAVSNFCGSLSFYETNLAGSGSLMKIGSLAESSYGAKQEEVFQVDAITLDSFFGAQELDVLQIDVQGAEKNVIMGGQQVLENAKSIFTEVSIKPNLYEGAVTLQDLNLILKNNGFQLVLLGLDLNLTGNALYLKYFDRLAKI